MANLRELLNDLQGKISIFRLSLYDLKIKELYPLIFKSIENNPPDLTIGKDIGLRNSHYYCIWNNKKHGFFVALLETDYGSLFGKSLPDIEFEILETQHINHTEIDRISNIQSSSNRRPYLYVFVGKIR